MREYRIPCGRGGGHGESCCEAQLCDACIEVQRTRKQLGLARNRAEKAEKNAHKYIKAEARTNIKLIDASRLVEELEERLNAPEGIGPSMLMCGYGHKWMSHNLTEICPWCEVKQLKAEVERLNEYLREFESSAKAALDGYRLVSEDESEKVVL